MVLWLLVRQCLEETIIASQIGLRIMLAPCSHCFCHVMLCLLGGFSQGVIQIGRGTYVAMRRSVAQAVKKTKHIWFRQKAQEVEAKVLQGVAGGAKGIRDIQRGRAGLYLRLLKLLMVSFARLQLKACRDGGSILILC